MASAIAVLGTALSASALSSDFVDEAVITGLTQPANVEFAADGRVFIAEKSGLVKVFDSLSDPTPDLFADLSGNVHNYWDRGLLGLAIHPEFPTQPYIYVLYTYDAPIGGAPPTWGDSCPNPPGATDDGCLVSGRLSRLRADGNQMSGSEFVLIEDWCQQYPSHSLGDLEFGADGALYVTGGDGASFTFVDYGQGGGDSGSPTPVNPCDDPPGGTGNTPSPPAAEGGALRSQDLQTSSDPVSLDGTVLRLNPITGEALSDNPLAAEADANMRRIVAYGLRNPFRLAVRPGTNELFIGDVGWNTWEEVNHHPTPDQTVRNFGWPCYEGGSGTSIRQSGYDGRNLDICEDLYGIGGVTPSYFAYRHDEDISGSDPCPPADPGQGTSSSISGLAFYEMGDYPGSFNGALFGSDFSRDCVWIMYPDASGNPDPATTAVFQHEARNPVDLEAGPGGDIFYLNINGGELRRFRFVGTNTPPTASVSADPTSGSAPLTVDFDATGSTDSDGDSIAAYEWDFDDDGFFDDAVGATTQWTYQHPGSFTAHLRVTDSRGESGTDSLTIQASNSPPVAIIDEPTPGLTWSVGESISFSGHADDPDEGTLPVGALDWELILHHCEDDGSCHAHGLESWDGVAAATFDAPDHEYPSWLELRLTTTDQFGAQDSASVQLDPATVDLTFETDPSGLDITFSGTSLGTPFAETVIVNSLFTVSAADQSQDGSGHLYEFVSWSDGGTQSHEITAPSIDATFVATFNQVPELAASPPPSVDEGTTTVIDLETEDDSDTEGSGLTYSMIGGTDQSLFGLDSSSGQLAFLSAPDFESPQDSDGDNVYVIDVLVADSLGATDQLTISTTVNDINDPPVAADDTYQTNEDTTLAVPPASGVLSNDTDQDTDPLTVSIITSTAHGNLDLDPDGSFQYTPDPDWNGQDTFTYQSCDPSPTCDTATATIDTDPINDPPVAANDFDAGLEDSSLSTDIAGNDDDNDNSLDYASVVIVRQPDHGTATPSGNGAVTFTPVSDWNGVDSYDYTIADELGARSAPATVTLTITPVNDPPTFGAGVDQSVVEDAGAQTAFAWAASISPGPPDESAQSVVFVLTVENPDLFSDIPTIDPDTGDLAFTPAPNANGSTTVTVVAADDGGTADGGQDTSAAHQLEISIAPINDPPIADAGVDQQIEVGETTQLDGTGSSDPVEQSALTYEWRVAQAPSGSAAAPAEPSKATTSFTPDLPGTYEMQLIVDDGNDPDADLMSIEVADVVNEPPAIVSNGGGQTAEIVVEENQNTVTDVESVDPEGELEGAGLSYAITSGADASSFTINGSSGVLGFMVSPDFETASDHDSDNVFHVEVTVTDSGGARDSQLLSVSIKDAVEDYSGTFKDDDNSIFEQAIEWLAHRDITRGCNPPDNDEFCPGDYVTRGQMATFFSRAFGWTDDGGGNLFTDDDGHLFEHALDLMGTAGVTKGCNPPANNHVCPDDYVTRGQMAAFFKRAFEG